MNNIKTIEDHDVYNGLQIATRDISGKTYLIHLNYLSNDKSIAEYREWVDREIYECVCLDIPEWVPQQTHFSGFERITSIQYRAKLTSPNDRELYIKIFNKMRYDEILNILWDVENDSSHYKYVDAVDDYFQNIKDNQLRKTADQYQQHYY